MLGDILGGVAGQAARNEAKRQAEQYQRLAQQAAAMQQSDVEAQLEMVQRQTKAWAARGMLGYGVTAPRTPFDIDRVSSDDIAGYVDEVLAWDSARNRRRAADLAVKRQLPLFRIMASWATVYIAITSHAPLVAVLCFLCAAGIITASHLARLWE